MRCAETGLLTTTKLTPPFHPHAASPELILDRKRDYILYAVDPVETYRSTAHRTRTPSASREPVFRGKGFFGWILEEEGDGDTVVVGKVSEVGRRRSASWSDDDSDEYDDTAYLDVEIRMKETEAQTREQFFARLGQFGTASAAGGRPAAATSGSSSSAAASPAPAPVPSKRKMKSSSKLSSSRPPLAHSASSPIRRTHSTPTVRTAPVQAQAPSSGQAQALQVLQLLQTLQAQQQQQQAQEQSAPSPAAASTPFSTNPLEALLRFSGGASNNPDNAALLTRALGDALKAAGLKVPSPTEQPTPSSSSNKLSRSKSTSSAAASSSEMIGEYRQCYNCGIIQSQQSVWRLPVLLEGTKVQVPDAFVHDPHRGANGTRPDDQNLTPDETGCLLANGRSTWRACNRCGLFYTKWKKNRPEKVTRKARDHTAMDDAVSSPAPAPQVAAPQPQPPAPAPSSSRKRASPEVDEIFEAGDEEEGDATQDEILGSSPPAPGGKRTKRDIDKELVRDKYGQWRSRRSVRENPEGRRSGRPQGRKNASGKKGRGKRCETSEARDESESAAEGGKTPAAAGDTSASSSSKEGQQQQQQQDETSRPYPQTSPLRSNSASGPPIVPIRTFPWSNVPPNAASLQSTPTNLTPSRRGVRYGAPSNILMSSPATALDQLLSEDFSFDFGNHTVGGGPGGVTQSSPIRRSPRKNPMGTREARNPFATTAGGAMMAPNAVSNGSPSRAGNNNDGSAMDASLFDMDIFSAFTNFKSPSSIVSSSEASKKPSPSSQSSQDAEASERRRSLRTRAGGPSSGAMTSLTSPSSPSPASHKRMRGHAALLQSSSPSVLSVKGLGANDDDDEDEDVGDSPSRAKEQRLKATSGPICPASPSLGQKRKRDASGATVFATPTAAAASASSPSMLTKGPSPAPNSASRRRGSAGSHIATTPRVTPRKSATQAQAGADDSGSTTILAVTASSRPPSVSPALRSKRKPSQSPLNLLVPGRRKPLPATVEDAPPSSAGSSPADAEEDDDEEEEGEDEVAFSPYDHASVSSLLEMFEDPYGILAANGIGLPGGANVVASNNGTNGGAVTSGSGNGGVAFSMDHFDDIQLHDRNQFPAHLRTFTQEGARGVAALAMPGWQQQQQQRSGSGNGVGQAGKEGQQQQQQGALTPTEDSGHGKPSTPSKKGSSSSSRPTAPLTPTRSSPRFHSTPNGGKARVAPPRTPSGDQGRASSSINKTSAAQPPRTPLAKLNNLSPTSLAALSRSPALQKALSNVVANGGATTNSPGMGAGTFDFTALFGSNAASLGSLSPLFATPRGSAGGVVGKQQQVGAGMGLPPLSPSLSRVLSQYGESSVGTPMQHHQQGDADADALALVPGSGAGAGAGAGEITASDLQQLFGDDPSWAAFLGAMGGGNGGGEGEGEQESGKGQKAATTAASS